MIASAASLTTTPSGFVGARSVASGCTLARERRTGTESICALCAFERFLPQLRTRSVDLDYRERKLAVVVRR